MTPLDRVKAAIASELGMSATPIEAFALSGGRMIATEALARAVLQAIREPSSAMVRQARSESHVTGECEVDYIGIWASMIDAALEQG